MTIRSNFLALAALLLLMISHAVAGDCCLRCGCEQHVRKVCRLVCDTKEVKQTCYSLECEDYCLPGPPRCCCHKSSCGECSKCVQPTCGKVRTKAKLVKREITRKVPITRCVVEVLCDGCCRQQPAEAESKDVAPAAPATLVPEAAVHMPSPPQS